MRGTQQTTREQWTDRYEQMPRKQLRACAKLLYDELEGASGDPTRRGTYTKKRVRERLSAMRDALPDGVGPEDLL